MARNKLNIGFVGGGMNSAVGVAHKSALAIDGNFDLSCGVFSSNYEINVKTAFTYGLSKNKAYKSISDLLHNESVDAIAVLTPSTLHKQALLELADSGVSVICEKPMVCTLAELNQIKERWQDDSRLFVIYNYTGYPMVREARSIIQEQRFGKVLQVLVEMPNEGFVRPPRIGGTAKAPQSWRLTDGLIPQAALDLATHAIQLMRFVTQEEVMEAQSRWANHTKFPQIKDTFQLMGSLTNCATFSVWTTKSALGCRNGLNIRVFCERGSIRWLQSDPEHLQVTDEFGVNSTLDRSTSRGEGYNPKYDRFKVGHPAGFIEALANYYNDIADIIRKKARAECPIPVLGLKDSFEELVLLEALSTKNEYSRRL